LEEHSWKLLSSSHFRPEGRAGGEEVGEVALEEEEEVGEVELKVEADTNTTCSY